MTAHLENTVLVSLVGTQIMGCLQPWLALRDSGRTGPAFLLYTDKTRPVAEKIQEFARAHDFEEVTLIPVPGVSVNEPDSADTIVETIAERVAATGGRVCFNLDGGMNFLINACVLKLAPFDPLFLQSSRWRSTLHDTETGKFSATPLPAPLPVSEILALQGVAYTLVEENPDQGAQKPVLEFCAGYGLQIPQNSLRNVKIGDLVFDLVWNPGNNRLSFFKDWRFRIDDSEKRLERVRDFTHWSTDRTRSAHLYDRQVFALTASAQVAERLVSESGGQIDAQLAPTAREAGNILEKWFATRANSQPPQELAAPKKACKAELRDHTLVVCMGRNLDSTLLAICSHKPEHLLLCYQKTDPVVAAHVGQILENYGELGLASAQAIPFGIEGAYPEQALPAVPAGSSLDVHINLSPGSKGQGASLTWWARRHNFGVWSLDNDSRHCSPLHNPAGKAPIPYDMCDPALYLRLKGMNLRSDSRSETDLEPVMPAMASLLEFLRAALAAGKDARIFQDTVAMDSSILQRASREFWELRANGKTWRYQVLGDSGKWFEELCAVALLQAGASHVRTNCARRWSEAVEYAIVMEKQPETTPHSLELDVVGTFEGDLVLISCKSGSNISRGAAAREVKATGANLGRFGLRILAHLHCPKACKTCEDAVLVIGWRELCQPEVLAGLIRELRESQRTTKQ